MAGGACLRMNSFEIRSTRRVSFGDTIGSSAMHSFAAVNKKISVDHATMVRRITITGNASVDKWEHKEYVESNF
jgi:hypothetical protein